MRLQFRHIPTLLVLAAAVPGFAEAAIYIANPVQDNSFFVSTSQRDDEIWNGNVVGPFDKHRMDWVSGAIFEVDGFRNYTDGWTASPGGTALFAEGTGTSPADHQINFRAYFTDDVRPFVFHYSVYFENTLRQLQEISYTGVGTINFRDLSAPVPEPGSMFLLGLAVGGIGLANLRRARSRKS